MNTNLNVKRLMKEFNDIKEQPLDYFNVMFKDDNIFVWYVLIKNLSDAYTNGEYLLQITFPQNYPFAAPTFLMKTPNGKFDINRNLCFSNSSYHQNEWSPLWTLPSIIIGFISMFQDNKTMGIGHINLSNDKKNLYAKQSIEYNDKNNREIIDLFKV
jgi:ubiquitin-protein ligase